MAAKAESLQKGLKICEHVAKRIEDKYKSQLEKRNTAYNDLLKTWNTYKSKNKGLKICEKIAAKQRVSASVCNAKLSGMKKELTACMGAEQMLKQEGSCCVPRQARFPQCPPCGMRSMQGPDDSCQGEVPECCCLPQGQRKQVGEEGPALQPPGEEGSRTG